MKEKRHLNKRIFITRIIETIFIVTSIAVMPKAITYATLQRGYKAIGGEYMLPMLALILIMAMENFLEWKKVKKYAKIK